MTGRSQLREDPQTGRTFQAEGMARPQVLRQEQTQQVQATACKKDRAAGVVVGSRLSCVGVLLGSKSMSARELWSQEVWMFRSLHRSWETRDKSLTHPGKPSVFWR